MNILIKNINKRGVLYLGIASIITIILTFVNYFFVFLPATNGNMYLEMKPFYTPSDIYFLAEIYGDVGRALYMSAALTIDMLLPLCVSLFLIAITILLYKSIFSDFKKIKGIVFLGIVICLSDWIENLLLITTLKLYPNQYPMLVIVAGIITFMKGIFMLCFVVLLAYITYRIVKKNKIKIH